MPRRLWICRNPACTVISFRTADGVCAKCREAGELVVVDIERGPP